MKTKHNFIPVPAGKSRFLFCEGLQLRPVSGDAPQRIKSLLRVRSYMPFIATTEFLQRGSPHFAVSHFCLYFQWPWLMRASPLWGHLEGHLRQWIGRWHASFPLVLVDIKRKKEIEQKCGKWENRGCSCLLHAFLGVGRVSPPFWIQEWREMAKACELQRILH